MPFAGAGAAFLICFFAGRYGKCTGNSFRQQKNGETEKFITGYGYIRASLYLRQAEENVSLLETKLAGLKKEFSGEKNLKILT